MNHTSKQCYSDKRNVLLVDEVDPVMGNLGGGHELPATRARLVPASLQPIMEKIEGEHVGSSSIVAKPDEPIWGIKLFATDHDIDDQKMRDLLHEVFKSTLLLFTCESCWQQCSSRPYCCEPCFCVLIPCRDNALIFEGTGTFTRRGSQYTKAEVYTAVV